jgi:cytoplasmic iron level regulating protein YaaA (DUF328/UPF0246 family)
MFALISPAKKMDFDTDSIVKKCTQPRFMDDTQNLIKITKKLSSQDLQNLMKISEKLGDLNHQRFKQFKTPFTNDNAHPAVLAFRGDTYVGLDADTLSSDDLSYAQKHLGILSGLYGVLRPLDLIQAYRLEMGTKLNNPHGEDLYDFWDDTLMKACEKAVKGHKDSSIISLASNEYIKAVKPKNLSVPFITCHFKELKNGTPKTIGLFAKRARGAMARYIIQNRIETAKDLKKFKVDGYKFMSDLSDGENYVFLREKK